MKIFPAISLYSFTGFALGVHVLRTSRRILLLVCLMFNFLAVQVLRACVLRCQKQSCEIERLPPTRLIPCSCTDTCQLM